VLRIAARPARSPQRPRQHQQDLASGYPVNCGPVARLPQTRAVRLSLSGGVPEPRSKRTRTVTR
jgi:hypothetical protein